MTDLLAFGPLPSLRPASGGPKLTQEHQRPSAYRVRLRYFIDADRTRHALEFQRMLKVLVQAGFVKDPGLEQEELYDEPISGRLPAAGLDRLLETPHLQTAILIPADHELPPGEQPVFVELTLTTRLGPARQRELFEKTRQMLKPLGWISGIGYDHRRFTRMLGWLPAQHLESLLLAQTSRQPQVRRDLLVDVPLVSRYGPFAVPGFILVPCEIRFQPLGIRQELLQGLARWGFEADGEEDLRDGLVGIVRGRLPTRALDQVRKLDGVKEVRIEKNGAIERLAPVLVARVIPEPEGSEPPTMDEPPQAPELTRISDELRKLLNQAGEGADKMIRVEVVLRETPNEYDADWQQTLDELRGLLRFEGRLGPLVSGLVRADEVPALAEHWALSSVRLPQAAQAPALEAYDPAGPQELPVDFVSLARPASPAMPLAALVRKRLPQRMAVVATDFAGYETFVGRGLPMQTRLLDFTAERNSDLTPEAAVSGAAVGYGTRLALALAEAGRPQELLLVQVHPESPYMLAQVVQAVAGRGWQSDAIRSREREIRRDAGRLDEERTALRVRRRLVLSNFSDDADAQAARQSYLRAQEDFDRRERSLAERRERLLRLLSQGQDLEGVSTVLIGVWWSQGHPSLPQLDSPQRYLTEHLQASGESLPDVAWIQAVPRAPGTTWQGLFRDSDGDGAMEFPCATTGAGAAVQAVWLAWQPRESLANRDRAGRPERSLSPELPGGAVIQITMQWQEVHDPAWKRDRQTDHYRQPLAPLQVVVLKQRDPSGKTALPQDAFYEVARSSAWIDRIANDQRTAIYQTVVRFRVPDGGGRYAIRIEGRVPESVLPPAASPLPGAPRAEIRPFLRLEVVDPEHQAQGHAVFECLKPGPSPAD
jgi:hypothetical protein